MSEETPGRQNQEQPGPAKRGPVGGVEPHPGVAEAIHRKRRSRVLQRLVVTAVLAVALVMVFLVGKEWFRRRDYLRGMRGFAEQVQAFRNEHGHWPSREQADSFKRYARIGLQNIEYKPWLVPKDAPPETVLAYLPLVDLTFLAGGHAAMDVSGRVYWLDDDELKRRLREREQLYNAELIQRGQ